MSNKKNQAISAAELSSFCGQVALILEAGLPLYDGMETLASAYATSDNADLYKAAGEAVNRTGSLYEALKEDGRWPDYLVEMVGLGEKSGQMETIMRGLETYYAREDRIRASIIGAVTYPLVLGILVVVIVLILLWQVLPVFRRVLSSMGVSLSESGSRLMNIGAAAGWVVAVPVGIILIAAIVVLLLLRTKHRDGVLASIRRIFPPLGRLSRKLSASRIAGILSMMLSGGFATDESLEMTANVLDDKVASNKVMDIRKGLEDGKTLSDSLSGAGIFDELHVRMIKIGSAAGREDQVLGKISELYESQAEEDITRLVSIIEPTLVALLSIVVGAVLMSVMLPMAGILTSL